MTRRLSLERLETFVDTSVDLPSRTIYMGSVTYDSDGKEQGVDSAMTEYAVKGIWLLNQADSREPITVLMNNIGGDWNHGMAIYDAIKASKAPVDIQVYGHAMSMGAVILQSGRKRIMHPHATIMIHDGYADPAARPVRSARSWARFDEVTCREMYSIFAQRSGQPIKVWRERCGHDTIYSAQQAVREGLADEVYGEAIIPRTNEAFLFKGRAASSQVGRRAATKKRK